VTSPRPVPGSFYSRDRAGVRTFLLKFLINGPGAEGGEEPLDLLDNFMPPAPLGLEYVGRGGRKLPSGEWELVIKFRGTPPAKI
jgi:hypothetical protein